MLIGAELLYIHIIEEPQAQTHSNQLSIDPGPRLMLPRQLGDYVVSDTSRLTFRILKRTLRFKLKTPGGLIVLILSYFRMLREIGRFSQLTCLLLTSHSHSSVYQFYSWIFYMPVIQVHRTITHSGASDFPCSPHAMRHIFYLSVYEWLR